MAVAAALTAECRRAAIALWPQRPVAAMLSLASNPRLTSTTSSAGRLFDAVSAIAGLCDEQSDEAQAAMLLEAAGGDFADASYEDDDFVVTQESGLNVLQVTALLQRLFAMRLEGRTPQAISMRFHAAFSAGIAKLAAECFPAGATVCLSGGTFLNRFVAADLSRRLRQMGYRTYLPSLLPPGDGAISFGQCAVARQRLDAATH